MSGDTDLQSQVLRLAESVLFLSEEVARLRKTINAMHDLNMDFVEIFAGLAEQDKALYQRVQRLESRRIHLYLGEDNNPCIGTGDWQDTLESFGEPRVFEDEDELGYYVRDEDEDK